MARLAQLQKSHKMAPSAETALSTKTRNAKKQAPLRVTGARPGLTFEPRLDPTRLWDGTREPALEDMLADPVIWKVMDRDGLTPQEVAAIMAVTRARLTASLS